MVSGVWVVEGNCRFVFYARPHHFGLGVPLSNKKERSEKLSKRSRCLVSIPLEKGGSEPRDKIHYR